MHKKEFFFFFFLAVKQICSLAWNTNCDWNKTDTSLREILVSYYLKCGGFNNEKQVQAPFFLKKKAAFLLKTYKLIELKSWMGQVLQFD